MKIKAIQIPGPKSFLKLVGYALVLITGLVLSSEQDHAAESGPQTGNFETFAATVAKVSPAVVKVVSTLRLESLPDSAGGLENSLARDFLGQVPLMRSGHLERGLGSGVIVTGDGYILTNGHLVTGANEVKVLLQDGGQFKGKVIGLDLKSDIAVLKIDGQHLPTVSFAESRNVQVGDSVLAFGYPFGVGQTVTHGIVSATDHNGTGTEDYENFIQTDAPINPGNSGGPLVDATGHLIGINTAILTSTGGNSGIGFAVPSDLARRVMADLTKYGYVVRGYLGVETQDLTPELAKEFKLHSATGVLVGGVVRSGPSDKAGVQIGDVIMRFDGKKVCSVRQLNRSVADAKPGQTVPIQVLRDGSATLLRITVGQVSNDDLLARDDRTAYENDPRALQGVIIGELNSELRRQLKIPGNVHGALVFGVNPFFAAAEAGLRPGDVIESINRQEVGNACDVSQLARAARHQRILLRVYSSGTNRFILIDAS